MDSFGLLLFLLLPYHATSLYASRCYYRITEPRLPYTKALKSCSDLNSAAPTLARIQTAEQNIVASTICDRDTDNLIGWKDDAWYDGTLFEDFGWTPEWHEDRGGCTRLVGANANWKPSVWDDWDCAIDLRHVCSYDVAGPCLAGWEAAALSPDGYAAIVAHPTLQGSGEMYACELETISGPSSLQECGDAVAVSANCSRNFEYESSVQRCACVNETQHNCTATVAATGVNLYKLNPPEVITYNQVETVFWGTVLGIVGTVVLVLIIIGGCVYYCRHRGLKGEAKSPGRAVAQRPEEIGLKKLSPDDPEPPAYEDAISNMPPAYND